MRLRQIVSVVAVVVLILTVASPGVGQSVVESEFRDAYLRLEQAVATLEETPNPNPYALFRGRPAPNLQYSGEDIGGCLTGGRIKQLVDAMETRRLAFIFANCIHF